MNLYKRSYEKELMDGNDIPFADMAQTLRELNTVNRRLGGHATTLKGVQSLMQHRPKLLICEIGCGGGDNLFAIHHFYSEKDIDVSFIGIDMNAECIVYAQQQYPHLPCQWVCSDYALVEFPDRKPDIIFSSLFCHHFTDEQLVSMLHWQHKNSTLGFFINDLNRHWLAFYLIKYITRYFSKSYLVKNDASLSVARSFTKTEWEGLFEKAALQVHSIRWRWAFRFLVIYKHRSES
ncbi:MAG: methyltransferase domain-containing protein [Chitinophagaceae bacterium]|nr:MAG: methyltransferase domain-containing protein [Chitinophagaceae bacterium]